ncbi:MAG TPA: polynucleotide adenylyltransferase PcnB [Burkholderiales bacterium]|nr:polynucleotide adenylyltransferase PcnB [Burkholderiales bacterium]
MTKQIISAPSIGLNQTMLDQDALQLIKKLQQHGFAAYVVGGGVRDLLLGRTPKDFDIVTDALPEKIRRIFGKNSMIIGRRFKIVHVYFEHLNEERSLRIGKPCYERHILEVSTYRSNQVHEHAVSEHGRILVDNNYGTIDEDAFRRDFTVNALYYDPVAEVVIDYHDGLADIEKRIIRIIGNPYERYMEDPVRVLRAIRLSEKLGLTIDEHTYINFRNAKHLLINEPKGRLFEEMLKILLSGNALNVVRELGELNLPRRVFPLFDRLFFHKSHDDFAYKVLEKTDLRIASGEDVSLVFILAGLIWSAIYQSWQQELKQGVHAKQALMDAIARNKTVIFNSGVTRNLYTAMRDMWMLQVEFDAPSVAKLDHLLNHNRFRQAWHLFTMRNDFLQVDPQIFAWWDNFMASADDDKTDLMIELVDLAPAEPKKKSKRRKSKRKRNVKKMPQVGENLEFDF